jgi:hypothetical protein
MSVVARGHVIQKRHGLDYGADLRWFQGFLSTGLPTCRAASADFLNQPTANFCIEFRRRHASGGRICLNLRPNKNIKINITTGELAHAAY